MNYQHQMCDCCGCDAQVEQVAIDHHDPNLDSNGMGRVMDFLGCNLLVAHAAFNLISCAHCGRKAVEIVCNHETPPTGSGCCHGDTGSSGG